MSVGIYKIENLVNGKIYIGQSIHIERRWQEHCRNSSKSLISKAIKKYGKENFLFSILEEVSDINTLNELESKYIRNFNSLIPNGYNVIIEDNFSKNQFNRYSYETFLEIIEEIKNPELSFQQLSEKYGLDLSMIYYLNRGDYHKLPNENYPLRNVKDFSKQMHCCIDCGKEISYGATRCALCGQKAQRTVERPNREELKELVRKLPFTKIGSNYGVTDNAIKKWCKAENLPYTKKDIKKYTDEEWEKI